MSPGLVMMMMNSSVICVTSLELPLPSSPADDWGQAVPGAAAGWQEAGAAGSGMNDPKCRLLEKKKTCRFSLILSCTDASGRQLESVSIWGRLDETQPTSLLSSRPPIPLRITETFIKIILQGTWCRITEGFPTERQSSFHSPSFCRTNSSTWFPPTSTSKRRNSLDLHFVMTSM